MPHKTIFLRSPPAEATHAAPNARGAAGIGPGFVLSPAKAPLSFPPTVTSCWIPAWRFGALLAVAAVAMANLVQTTRRVPPAARDVEAATFDPLTWHEQRFGSFRARAAALGVTGTIGYIGDHDSADDDYYYAQFALAPLLLDIDPAPHAWAVANLRTTSAAARISGEWAVAQDFGSGVLLLRKSAR